jgi:DNA-binding beta-propeller fold protein YncE
MLPYHSLLNPMHRCLLATSLLIGAAQLSYPASSAWALCGDLTGDGIILANDALATLKKAVLGEYVARGDSTGGPRGDGALLASDALAVLKAAVSETVPLCASFTATRVVVSTASARFDSSGVAVVDLETHEVRYTPGLLHRDSVVRHLAGEAVFINRFGANTIQRVSLDGEVPENIKECSVSDGFDSNPHDVIAVGGKAYVTLYEGSLLRVLNPASLQTDVDPACAELIVDRIDLEPLSDEDGLPEMDQLGVYEGKLYVSLQMLDHDRVFEPAGSGRIAIIDPTTDVVVSSIDLQIENPFLETKGLIIDEEDARLYIGGPGRVFTNLNDGGLEIIDLNASQSLGVAMDGATLGGDLFDLAVVGRKKAFAIVADKTENRVVAIDPEAGVVLAKLLSSVELITDIEVNEAGELWVAFRERDADVDPGLRVFSVTDFAELTPTPIFPGSLPFTLTFSD